MSDEKDEEEFKKDEERFKLDKEKLELDKEKFKFDKEKFEHDKIKSQMEYANKMFEMLKYLNSLQDKSSISIESNYDKIEIVSSSRELTGMEEVIYGNVLSQLRKFTSK